MEQEKLEQQKAKAAKKVTELKLTKFVELCDKNEDAYVVFYRKADNSTYAGIYDRVTKDDAILFAAGLFAMYGITRDEIDERLKKIIHEGV